MAAVRDRDTNEQYTYRYTQLLGTLYSGPADQCVVRLQSRGPDRVDGAQHDSECALCVAMESQREHGFPDAGGGDSRLHSEPDGLCLLGKDLFAGDGSGISERHVSVRN